MDLTLRTKMSLCQFLGLFAQHDLTLLFLKHGLVIDDLDYVGNGQHFARALKNSILQSGPTELGYLVQEIARTHDAMRTAVSPRYVFDQRWNDLLLCLELDDYALEREKFDREVGRLIPIEPQIQGAVPLADDLTHELERATLPGSDAILDLLEKSATAFRLEDFNACLADARVALQTLAKSTASLHRRTSPPNFDPNKWAQVVNYLRTSNFINRNEEEGITGVYSLISPGSHTPLGFTDREFARLGRSLAVSICYFLAKRLNARKPQS